MSSRSIRAKQFIFLSTLLYIHLLTVRGGYQEHIIHRHCDRRGPCLNLSTIVDNTSIYPNSNTTLIFQQGDHYLDSELDVSGKEFLVLSTNQSSESFSILYCRDNDRLKFSNISQLRMRSLKFIRCSIIVDRFNLEDSSFDGENANSSALQLSQTNVESLQRNFASFKLMCFVCYSYDVMKRCWNANKTDQPLFTTLHKTLQDYSTSEDLTNLISLQNIDSYYQPRRHQSVRGIGGERLERRQQGEDGLESREEGRQGEEGGEIVTVMADGASDALRAHHFSNHILPQILEDKAEETTEEQEADTERRLVEGNCGSGSNKPSRSEESDHGTINNEGFVSGAVTPTSLEEGQTEILRLRSETTTPDSGYNMS